MCRRLHTRTLLQMDAPAVVVSGDKDASGLSVLVHPLVLFNISEHFTRIRANAGKTSAGLGSVSTRTLDRSRHLTPVYGALVGVNDGRHVEIFNSFELVVGEAGNLDPEYFVQKSDQCTFMPTLYSP